MAAGACWVEVLIYFGGIPLAATLGVRALYRLINQLTPPIIDEMPSFGRMFLAIALLLLALWFAQCHLGLPLGRGSGCVCD
jgi:hypothetical protein